MRLFQTLKYLKIIIWQFYLLVLPRRNPVCLKKFEFPIRSYQF